MITKNFKLLSLLRPSNRSLSVERNWNEIIKPYWKGEKPFNETAKLLKEIAQETVDITILGQYCVFLYGNYQWLDIYQAYLRIQKFYRKSFIPGIFDSLYQLENKSDDNAAIKLLDKVNNTNPIEDRCLSILLDKMEMHTKALDHLYRYLDSKESSNDIIAQIDKINLELICKKPAKALSSSKSLLTLIPNNTKIRLAKIDALRGLNKRSQAIIELSVLIGETSDPTVKARLYKRRAIFRRSKEVNEKVCDWEMSDKLCRKLEGRKDMFKFLYKEQMLEILNDIFNKTVTKEDIENDFDIAIMKGDLCRAVEKNPKKASEIYNRVNSKAPAHYKARVSARMEIVKEQLKHDGNKD